MGSSPYGKNRRYPIGIFFNSSDIRSTCNVDKYALGNINIVHNKEKKEVKFKIPEDIVKKAAKCEKKLRCLSENNENICKVLCHMEFDICFVKCSNEDKDCPYFEPHTRTSLCKCPVRNEIYMRYKV
jgi:hypothetical protein